MERKNLILLFILCLIVVLYGVITFQWGMMLYLIVLIVLIFLILELLYKFGKHIEISKEFERKLTSDIESLNESLNSIKDEIYKRKE
jgi:uncharacterized ion transporter superfamily protein YfcC